ncbi:hypothetical protein B0T13DRAFT_481174 [Neurospora crassa]|nr:hypothetical protein B0T13DRAFT_481174 [Neurospora crassa]
MSACAVDGDVGSGGHATAVLVLRMACGVCIYARQPKGELCVMLIAGYCLKGVACYCFASLSNCFQGYQLGRGI